MVENANRSWMRIGVAVGLAVLYGFVTRLVFGSSVLSTVSIGFLCLVPFIAGALTVFFAPQGTRTQWNYVTTSPIATSMIFLVGVLLFNIELVICIVLILPLFATLALVGGVVMRFIIVLYEKYFTNRQTLNSLIVALVLLPYLVTPVELRLGPADLYRTIHDQVTIDGTSDVIWQHIIRVYEIAPDEQRTSLFNILGIPRPVESQLQTEGIGAVRKGVFESGLLFHETITTWEPNLTISFDIDVDHTDTSFPPLLEIGSKHFDVLNATYEIEPLDDGRVILHLSSTYRLSTSINAYATIWADLILHDFQQYILRVVRERVEQAN